MNEGVPEIAPCSTRPRVTAKWLSRIAIFVTRLQAQPV